MRGRVKVRATENRAAVRSRGRAGGIAAVRADRGAYRWEQEGRQHFVCRRMFEETIARNGTQKSWLDRLLSVRRMLW